MLPDGKRLLDDVNLDIQPGELVAIVGRSGAGKSTLLDSLAGVRTPTTGEVRFDGGGSRPDLAYVPQDDIVHRDLTVEATIRYAARLRLPANTPSREIDAVVDRTLSKLDLTDRRHLAVGALSGGQRKRASIATELVTEPRLCFLDEPTAGLDPVASASLMDLLRTMADGGTTVIMATHDLGNLTVADRLIVVADGGRVVFDGAPADAAARFGVGNIAEVCRSLASLAADGRTATPVATAEHGPPVTTRGHDKRRRPPGGRGGWHQWRVLSRRNVELLIRNRLSLAIMVGSPVLVVAMFAVLFAPGAFGTRSSNPTASIAITYWVAFAAFFFGLTFGLLQICTESAILRRERLATIGVGSYLLAKVAVLVPVLLAVNLVMVATLTGLGRLPSLSANATATLITVLLLDALAGLALGLLASAAVSSPTQAALALPMLCFPAVLFSGAIVAVRSMAVVGQAISAVVSDRWGFEAIASTLGLDAALGRTAIGRQLAGEHGDAFAQPVLPHALVLAGLTVVLLGAAYVVVDRRSRQQTAR